MFIRQKPTEDEQRDLSSGGRAFLQYLCDAGISGDTASKLNDLLMEIRDGDERAEMPGTWCKHFESGENEDLWCDENNPCGPCGYLRQRNRNA